MSGPSDEISRLETAYRRAKFTIIGHVIFIGTACFLGVFVRRAAGLPPIFLATVFIVALVLFGGDIMRFFYCRNELKRLRENSDS
jgi:hypothetical protein